MSFSPMIQLLPSPPPSHPSPTPHTPQGYPPNQSCVHSNASHTVGGADKMPQDGEHRIQYSIPSSPTIGTRQRMVEKEGNGDFPTGTPI